MGKYTIVSVSLHQTAIFLTESREGNSERQANPFLPSIYISLTHGININENGANIDKKYIKRVASKCYHYPSFSIICPLSWWRGGDETPAQHRFFFHSVNNVAVRTETKGNSSVFPQSLWRSSCSTTSAASYIHTYLCTICAEKLDISTQSLHKSPFQTGKHGSRAFSSEQSKERLFSLWSHSLCWSLALESKGIKLR